MNRYPEDEELNRFIEELEQKELYAPAHLKEEILLRAAKQVSQNSGKRNEPVSFLTYTLKIVAGMAAAIFLVFMIPVQNGSDVSRAEIGEQKMKASERISFDERISSFFEKQRQNTEQWEQRVGNKLNLDSLGGNNYED